MSSRTTATPQVASKTAPTRRRRLRLSLRGTVLLVVVVMILFAASPRPAT